ncbi:MAG: Eco57I restriction-modification methylase domain-containing protein [Planctomycetales bacterium]
MPGTLDPVGGERPTVFADRIGRAYSIATSAAHKKCFGQYLTPVPVADFMASLLDCDRDEIRILDPGAGSGVLACAAAEAIARRDRPPRRLLIDAYESDRELLPILEGSMRYLRARLRRLDIALKYRTIGEDFVLEHAAELRRNDSLFRNGNGHGEYDVVIGNPPYFKLAKSDPRSNAADDVVHGQPNIYALFMAISAAVLAPAGELVFITPRSFASGPYFRRFRERFFTRLKLEALHLFDSRRDAFSRDGVLQENMILKGRAREHGARVDPESSVRISISRGAGDIHGNPCRTLPLSDLLDMHSKDKMLRVPSSEDDDRVISLVDSWAGSLSAYGMQISTGPVVPFRAVELLAMEGNIGRHHAPLLWLQNVHAMRVEWPTSARRKPQHISTTSRESLPLLVRDRNYVLLRRFSAKEERRRLTAAPLLEGQLGSEWVGIENHLNYIHRPGGSLTKEEAIGLAIIYNSEFMDSYFRILNGSTQVSATEIRRIPLPPHELIVDIGRERTADAWTTPRSRTWHGWLCPTGLLPAEGLSRVRKVKEAQAILAGLGLPPAQCNEISAFTLLALCGLKRRDPWAKAFRSSLTITKGIMAFIHREYGKSYAPNTRETFRRQVLHQFVQACIADYKSRQSGIIHEQPQGSLRHLRSLPRGDSELRRSRLESGIQRVRRAAGFPRCDVPE